MFTGNHASGRKVADAPASGGRRLARAAALTAGATLALTACSSSYETYIEGYWDNGDGIAIVSKTELFDADGNPTCGFAVPYERFESRATSSNLVQGVLREIANTEPDPNAPISGSTDEEVAKEQQRRDRLQGSLDVLWQYTSPAFDSKYGISTPDDLAPIKAELQAHLPGLGEGAPIADYFKIDSEYFQTADGKFNVRRLDDPETFLTFNEIDVPFEGLTYTYYELTGDGQSWLLTLNRKTGEQLVYEPGSNEGTPLEGAVYHATYLVYLDFAFKQFPDASIEVSSDGCTEQDGKQHQRYYWSDYELLEQPAEGTVPDGFASSDDEEPAASPEPSPAS